VRSPVTIDQHAGGHPAGWNWVPLTDVAELATGHTPDRTRADYWNGGIPWISLTEIRELDGRCASTTDLHVSPEGIRHSSAVVLPPGTVCFSRTASIGFVTIMGAPMATSQDFVNWICGDDLDPRYLMHALRCSRRQLRGLSAGSTHKTIYVRVAEMFRVLLPPLEYQRRIADLLDRADVLRAKRRTSLAQLDLLTYAIFADMFGGPSDGATRWPVLPVSSYVAAFQGGRSFESDSGGAETAGTRVLKISAVTGMTFRPWESKPVPDDYHPPAEHFVRAGDLLISRANTAALVGAVAHVDATPKNLLLPDKLWRFLWKEPSSVEPLFVWALFQTPAVRHEVSRRATGTGGSMKNISQKKLLEMRTIVPPLRMQQAFVERLRHVRRLKTRDDASLTQLDALFASLQHRAFRGEL
jgi:type I restriction enzyme, S subunit